MRKVGLFFLCLAVFLLCVAGGGAWLYLSPRGVMRQDLPENAMQSYLREHDADYFRGEYLRMTAVPVTEFEDGEAVAARLYDGAVTDGHFTFREEAASERSAAYILSAGDTDLFRATWSFRDNRWQMDSLEALDAIHGKTHSVTALLPEDAVLTLNGKEVGAEYITEDGILYPDMTELEKSFDAFPTRVRYTVNGLYETPAVDADREGGLVLLSADGQSWEYTLPDAAGYSFAVSVPQGAVVTVNGTRLTDAQLVGSSTLTTPLDVPEVVKPYLPSMNYYAAGGLYTLPEITVTAADGTLLTGEGQGDLVTYSQPGTDGLYEQHHERVESFLRELIDYGAGHSWAGKPGAYVAADSEISPYLTRASSSLHWTVNVNLTFQDVSSSEYVALGDGAFLCRGHAEFTTKTAYQTKEISMDYDMLWVNQDGGAWLIWDLAFA